jgi:hypothetical protein
MAGLGAAEVEMARELAGDLVDREARDALLAERVRERLAAITPLV